MPEIDVTRPDACPICKRRGKAYLDVQNRVVVFICRFGHKWRDVSAKKNHKSVNN